MDVSLTQSPSMMTLNGIDVAVTRQGSGAPLLLLTNEDGTEAGSKLVDLLAKDFEVIVPDAPGFGASPDDERLTNVDDIAYLYLDLIDHLKLRDVRLVGFSLGGWIAAEMATKSCQNLGRIALVDSYGIKIGGPYDRDIADIYVLPRDDLAARTYGDPSRAPDFATMDEAAVRVIARNRLATVRYCWEPYMHNPKLLGRLHRISVPTFVVWGEKDGIVTPAYGRAYAAAIPGAVFETMAGAGHLPQLEQPERAAAMLRDFLKN